jgi:cytosine/adenosine deaminase-related metal-dependent hydrolase
MIVRARVVVTMDGAPIENGAVAISDNRIFDVGVFKEVKARYRKSIDDSPPGSSPSRASRLRRAAPAGFVVDLGEQALLPGLINAHCHLDYTCLRGKIPPPKSFADWIRAINAAKARMSEEDYVASINEGFAEAKRFGTTTIANLTAYPELIAKIDEPIRTWWFAELIDIRSPDRANEMVDLAIESLKSKKNWGLAPHALFTASPKLFHRCEEIARHENILLTTHLAESREEMSMFRDGSGPLYEFIKEIGRSMDDCGHETPLEKFVGTLTSGPLNAGFDRALPQKWIITHLNELSQSDFDLLARSARKFHVVHSPRSHDYFAHSPFPFERLRALGFNICLGTDSLASNENLSLFEEMRAFQRNEPNVSPRKIFEMVTVNAARALNQQNALGRIRPGFHVDLTSIPCSGPNNLFEEIVAFDQASTIWLDGKRA